MRLLHTADLHLGRQFGGLSLEDDQQAVLDQIARAVVAHKTDVLVIAGDVFDRAAPPEQAVRQFNAFLSRIASDSSAAVAIIAGNHDSAHRLASMAVMADARRVLIRGVVSAEERPLLLHDEHGVVAISGLPFCYEHAARECFAGVDIANPHDVLEAQVAAARRHIPANARWVIAAHAFVAGAMGSNSERPLVRVGGIETVPPEVFAGAHYVALGHLHRPQSVGAPHIRYAGSPLAFGFDEAGAGKSMSLVEIDAAGAVTITDIPFAPLRGVRVLTGRHAELLLEDGSEDFIKVVLTDQAPVIDGMNRLRDVFPNACELVYARDERAPSIKSLEGAGIETLSPLELIGGFLQQVGGDAVTDPERQIVAAVLHAVQNAEHAA